MLALAGELFAAGGPGDERVVTVLTGDDAGEVVWPEFKLSFSWEQPRVKASHKQPTKATVKRCGLEFRTEIYSPV